MAGNSDDRGSITRRAVVHAAIGASAALAAVPTFARDVEEGASNAVSAVQRKRYMAASRGISLQLYRVCRAMPKRGSAAGPVVILAHGSTISAPSSFDLQVPSGTRYSMMEALALDGFDVWALDFDGYGRSGWSGGNSNIDDGAEDLIAAGAVIERETGQKKYSLYGQSSGALRIGAYAMRQPERVERLVLESFVWTGEGSPTLIERAKRVEEFRSNPRRPINRSLLGSITARSDRNRNPEVSEAMAKAELSGSGWIPSGTYLDMVTRLPLVDPARLDCPTMILRGEHDEIATEEDLLAFFARLKHPTRQYIRFAGQGHGLAMSSVRKQLWKTVATFLPPPDPPA
ncbi:MAG: alpha/beta hydrolase [Sphingopyxis sp.]|nr:alpha/beta hydrolase [Sphingopyxis sp.]